ncbi:methyltransferase type 11 [Prosthecochloris sp. GSB1]|uniref:class I SAM-dependent methyltransferase n=1 Tax=Prosthecochloris sp. GSB1 TaxID=281093 RepID=UPI000B8D0DE6|nr:class I SAM-dependent methyltransferase [Prosthecochloris sp. GSB1]ASQ90468.1 methyltransferase type 11 [Prosthecochloris sp. GSB1]
MSVKEAFDKGAREYDSARKQLIPCFDEFYGTALDLIWATKTDNIKVLDLGAGTGLFASLVSQRLPNAELTLCDISSAMLDEARNRFRNSRNKVEYLAADYSIEVIPGQYDLIISALSIHHLSDAEKEELFKRLFRALNNGGLFINADQVLGETARIEEMYRKTWLRQVKENGVSDSTLASALERMKEDKMSTLSSQLSWMKNAGFADVNCWYKNYSFAVYSGRKHEHA